jgi:hypothetical protein
MGQYKPGPHFDTPIMAVWSNLLFLTEGNDSTEILSGPPAFYNEGAMDYPYGESFVPNVGGEWPDESLSVKWATYLKQR